MTRTKAILVQEHLLYESSGVDCFLSDIERAFERFMLALDEETFNGLMESLVRQREALGEQGERR